MILLFTAYVNLKLLYRKKISTPLSPSYCSAYARKAAYLGDCFAPSALRPKSCYHLGVGFHIGPLKKL